MEFQLSGNARVWFGTDPLRFDASHTHVSAIIREKVR